MRVPAVDVRGADPELALAVADDFSPSAVEELADGVAIFFRSTADRDLAGRALALAFPAASIAARDVDDEDWARRSQQNLTPITVGRVTVLPPWARTDSHPGIASHPQAGAGDDLRQLADQAVSVVIAPSMGFGTGHHATTRLCLAALQALPLDGRRVLDVGTGSGVLALAARMLGASTALGVDVDADAVSSARENLGLNPSVEAVRFEVADLLSAELPTSDVVLANLTGAGLAQHARRLMDCVGSGGTLIVSGFQQHERDSVRTAFAGWAVSWEQSEAGWVGLALRAA